MSFPEDEGPTGSSNPLKQSRYYQFVFPVLFFGAIGAIVWYLGAGLMHLGLANSEIENGNLFGGAPKAAAGTPDGKTTVGAAFNAAVGAGGSRGGDARSPEEKGPDEGGMVAIVHVEEVGVRNPRGTPRSVRSQASAPPPKPVTEWKLRGTVYDLTTLKPLASCAIQFTDEARNRSIMTRTDSGGRYRALVPPLSSGRGYGVAIERSGYAPNYLDPGVEGVREMSADQRRNLARGLSATLAAEPATVQSAGEKPVVTDFFLAPRP